MDVFINSWREFMQKIKICGRIVLRSELKPLERETVARIRGQSLYPCKLPR